MFSKVTVISLSNKVHPATEEMLMRYPMHDLKHYARSLGINPGRTTKKDLVPAMVACGATICGAVGN